MGKSTKRKVKKNVAKGIVHIKATFNNTHVTITDPKGDTISWGAAGAVGFKGTRKSTSMSLHTSTIRREIKFNIKGTRARVVGSVC